MSKHLIERQNIKDGRYINRIPTEAETFGHNEFVIIQKIKSQYVNGKVREVVIGTQCPSCKDRLPAMEHGDYVKCGSCALEMQLFGNGLSIWRHLSNLN
jgi:hypothetical protein